MAVLTGMKDIQKHVNFSEATVLAWIRNEGFPAKKLGGVWISDTESISQWFVGIVESVSLKPAATMTPPGMPTLTKSKNGNRRGR
jgi:hypothetical protein